MKKHSKIYTNLLPNEKLTTTHTANNHNITNAKIIQFSNQKDLKSQSRKNKLLKEVTNSSLKIKGIFCRGRIQPLEKRNRLIKNTRINT